MKQLPKYHHSHWDTVERAEIVDERTARIPRSGIDRVRDDPGEGYCMLRITPPDQKTVGELLFVGDLIRTSYWREGEPDGKVVSIHKYLVYELPVWSITYVPLDAQQYQNGKYRDQDLHFINELVAQDNRILMLFVANEEEVFIHGAKGQMGLFRYV